VVRPLIGDGLEGDASAPDFFIMRSPNQRSTRLTQDEEVGVPRTSAPRRQTHSEWALSGNC
jgi:hypothetical protein